MSVDTQQLLAQVRSLLESESDLIANAANLSALLFQNVSRLNWLGFYFIRNGELVVGPFQGLPACTRIPIGKGVCGAAVLRCESVVVEDVHEFPGHIACDVASRSEVVVPLIVDGLVMGVLDVDSPNVARFDDNDRLFFEAVVGEFVAAIKNWSGIGPGIDPS